MYLLFGMFTRVRYLLLTHKPPQFPNLSISLSGHTNFCHNKTSQVLLFMRIQTYFNFLSFHLSVILKMKAFHDRSLSNSSSFWEYIFTVCYQSSHLLRKYIVHVLKCFCGTHFKAVILWSSVRFLWWSLLSEWFLQPHLLQEVFGGHRQGLK